MSFIGSLKLQTVECNDGASEPRVLIVAENASESFGGEAALPLQYFRMLRARGVQAWLLTHARVREELQRILPAEAERIHYVEETLTHRVLWRLGTQLESRLQYLTTGFLLRATTQIAQRRIARRLIHDLGINLVHQPTPASPREPSLLYGLGVPVIIGPMNGNMSFPPSLRHEESLLTRLTLAVGRASAGILNTLFPGKCRASMLLVANERSRQALTSRTKARIRFLSENGVDTTIWKQRSFDQSGSSACGFVFVGRLIPSKGVDLWLRALEQLLARNVNFTATIVGAGPERERLEEQARLAGMLANAGRQPGKVWFAGYRSQSEIAELIAEEDCLVLPTLIESGGAVLLEAMAVGLPVISTNWGGPADYVDQTCGILVELKSREQLVVGLVEAMQMLAANENLRRRLGEAGRAKVHNYYTWDKKVDRIISYYNEVLTEIPSTEFANHFEADSRSERLFSIY